MNRIMFPIALLLIINIIFTVYSFAQEGMVNRGGGVWGPKSSYNINYNPASVETIKGEVVSLNKISPMKGMSYGIHIMLKTNKEKVSVYLGPAWYFNNNKFFIKVKDKIEIKGSRTTYDGKPAIIAGEIKRGEETIKIRDENGYPVWGGGRKNK